MQSYPKSKAVVMETSHFHNFDQLNGVNHDHFHVATEEHRDANKNFLRMDFFDFNGNFLKEQFEQLTGVTYMNYLHLHDDMI